MEATCSSEMSVVFQQTTQSHIAEDRTLHNYCCEYLNSNNTVLCNFATLSGSHDPFTADRNLMPMKAIKCRHYTQYRHLHIYLFIYFFIHFVGLFNDAVSGLYSIE
jgi:hypothetical protein